MQFHHGRGAVGIRAVVVTRVTAEMTQGTRQPQRRDSDSGSRRLPCSSRTATKICARQNRAVAAPAATHAVSHRRGHCHYRITKTRADHNSSATGVMASSVSPVQVRFQSRIGFYACVDAAPAAAVTLALDVSPLSQELADVATRQCSCAMWVNLAVLAVMNVTWIASSVFLQVRARCVARAWGFV